MMVLTTSLECFLPCRSATGQNLHLGPKVEAPTIVQGKSFNLHTKLFGDVSKCGLCHSRSLKELVDDLEDHVALA